MEPSAGIKEDVIIKQPLFADITTLPPFLSQKYIPSLDGFRAFSIILVIISHIAYNFNHDLLAKYDFGQYGVSVFFVISGFLITLLLIKEKVVKSKISLKDFYIRRFLRILPVAYLFLAVLLVLNWVFALHLSAGEFLRPFFFVENFGDHSNFAPSKHYWSLSVEEQFYIIFPFIISRSLKNYLYLAIALIPGIIIITYLFYHNHSSNIIVNNALYAVYHILCHGISTILIGSIAAIILCKYEHLMRFKSNYISLIQIGLLALSWFLFRHKILVGVNSILSAVCITLAIIYTIINTDGFFFKILNNRYVRYLGTLSYSLYIWQQIFTYKQPWANAFPYGKSIVLNLVLLGITAVASYHLYEKTFLKLKTRFNRIK